FALSRWPFRSLRAQRLSASSEFSRHKSCQRSMTDQRAQRLSASSEFSLPSQPLNSIDNRLCSTPFGIIGILTFCLDSEPPKRLCAQRLSASSEFSRAPGVDDRTLQPV